MDRPEGNFDRRRWDRAPWLVLVAVVVVGSVAVSLLAVEQRALRRQESLDRTGLLGAVAEQAVVAAELDRVAARIDRTSAAITDRLDEIDRLDSRIAETLRRLDDAGRTLTGAAQALTLRVVALETTYQCLLGVRRALDRVARDDFDGTLGALRSVDDVCRRAVGRPAGGPEGSVLDANFPDPFVLRVDGRYFAYATNGTGGTVQLAAGGSPADLNLRGDALHDLPAWATQGLTWGPAVLRRGGAYVMYYTAKQALTGATCISRAAGLAPEGPFVDDSTGPFLCQSGGSIDPSPFVDPNGSAWLVWKAERSGEGPGRIFAQQLRPDGMALLGPAVPLIGADQDWEGGVVEGPSLVRHGDRYVLLYSGNEWRTDRYAIGWADCATPVGPCTKPDDHPLLASTASVAGPGGQEVFSRPDGTLAVAYHGWAPGDVGYPNSRRLYVADLTFDDRDHPVVTPRPSG